MTAMWSVEFKYKAGERWRFSAAYPTLKEARAWVKYIEPKYGIRVSKWVRP